MSDPVVVCGAGIVGLSAALGLSRAGIDTVLVAPKQPLPSKAPGVYCPRVYALSPASQRFLAEQGVWDMLDQQRITPVESMQIYGDASGQVSLNAWQAAHHELAWIIESDELERVLRQAVQLFRVNWLDDRFQGFDQGGVSLASGKSLPAALVIGAEGAQSVVRSAAGIAHHSKPYGYAGVVTHLHTQRPHQGTAFQWFTADGIIAFLPMPDTADGHQVSLVWSMPQDQADVLMALDAPARAEWLASRLTGLAGDCFGAVSVRSPVHAFPLFCEHSDMVAPGVALVGDAAHRVHPLAGQGLNLGLGDVQELLRVLVSKESYRSPGDLRVLSRYRRSRAEPVLAMRAVTDGLHRLFAVQAPPVVMARNLGMQLVDRLPWVKRRLIQGASR
ncbi:FAD-dependent monooxygenase [Pusillimonas minor]|uniref:FAD-dependent monooxygenase n=1 Tax=Pusillimonas minor TaxID=2697024 RepID=A0A842HNH1_9BURK|nr:FAD-dependent monooxygenase [Pusillimonas minor]MBC2768840.1 FAD-dependent monooxygenase [Pusillimonas minor]